jgi:hypothetical protein
MSFTFPKLAVMIPFVSTFIILHISLDQLLLFQLRVNHYLDLRLAVNICTPYSAMCRSNVPAFIRSLLPILDRIQVPFLLPEDYPSDIRSSFANRHIPSSLDVSRGSLSHPSLSHHFLLHHTLLLSVVHMTISSFNRALKPSRRRR